MAGNKGGVISNVVKQTIYKYNRKFLSKYLNLTSKENKNYTDQ